MKADRRYSITSLAATLKQAREAKGMSQRTLGELSGVPQSHISKIESGAVDVRVSSLIEIARVLDLEPVLVPRKTRPAVESIVRSASTVSRPPSRAAQKAWKDMLDKLVEVPDPYVQRLARELRLFRPPAADRKTLRALNERVDAARTRNDVESVHLLLAELERLRAALERADLDAIPNARPAYALEENEDGE